MTLKEFVYQTLRDDDTLHTLLGKTETPYGIYWLNPPRKPPFPIITYFINSQSGDFPRVIPFNITCWTKQFGEVLDRVYTLLHDAAVTVDDYGFVLIKYDWSSSEMYDDDFKIWHRQDRFLAQGVRKI